MKPRKKENKKKSDDLKKEKKEKNKNWKEIKPPYESILFKPYELAVVVSAFIVPLHYILQKEAKSSSWRLDLRLYKADRKGRVAKKGKTYNYPKK